MIKVVKKCSARIKKLEKTRKGVKKIILLKLEYLENLKQLNPVIVSHKTWQVYKIYGTSHYGAYRIIVAENKLENKLVCDFYFKNEKSDMSKTEYLEIKDLLKQCQKQEFFNSLDDF